MSLSALEHEIAGMIVSTLNLEISADEIAADEPLFGETGLGLDSIDALELALVIDRDYGIKISAEDEDNEANFASLRALSDFIKKNRK